MEEASKRSPEAKKAAARVASSGEVQRYQAMVGRLAQLHQNELDLLSKYTPASLLVKLLKDQIVELEKERASLEEKFPELAASNAPAAAPPIPLAGEKA